MKQASKEALERFDKAAQDYGNRHNFRGPNMHRLNTEAIQEYEWAKAEIMEYLK